MVLLLGSIAFSIQYDGLARGQKSLMPDIFPPRQTPELNEKRNTQTFRGDTLWQKIL